MSVYTRVSRKELEAFLERYDQGRLLDFRGINQGIENTNYFVTTDRNEFVLTLFETVEAEDLPFFLGLTAHLAERGVPSAHPVADRQGQFLQHLNGKAAALVQKLHGKNLECPDIEHCRAIGDALARLHVAARDYTGYRDNARGYEWWQEMKKILPPLLTDADRQLLHDELRYQEQHHAPGLPRDIIHADLFRDNAMFVDHELTGIIDFYYACNDALAYDLAITINDWCSDASGCLEKEKFEVLFEAYNKQRPLTVEERAAWPRMMRAAALRFWLSRLYDQHFPRPGEITHIKDPDIFKRILIARRDHGDDWLSLRA